MKIAVAGLWHLGSVTAACLAQAGFDVVGVDEASRVAELSAGRAPILEPGLDELLATGIAAGRLRFSADSAEALRDADVLWVTYDTPVDENDHADVEQVVAHVEVLLPRMRSGGVVLVSSQVPVGTTRRLRDSFLTAHAGGRLHFAYSPENLRLGKAISTFVTAERIVVGCESPDARAVLELMLRALGRPIIWMGLESAEMVKHTINTFLATCVTFINEVASICERVGANAGEVEAGIRSEPRIGPHAYVTPGGAFGGGTLARDVAFLAGLSRREGLAVPLIDGILPSNQQHAGWAFRRARELLGGDGDVPFRGKRIAVLGLTYKPNTSTLRRSTAVQLCQRLHMAGAELRSYDPAVREVPSRLASVLAPQGSVTDAVTGADAVIVATEWPAFKAIEPQDLLAVMRGRIVLDAGGFAAARLAGTTGLSYFRVGRVG